MKNILLSILLFIPVVVMAQEKITVSGYIFDASTKEPLIGASIINKHGGQGVSSNEFGYYSLTIPEQDSVVLSVSFVGYRSVIKVVGRADSCNVLLQPGLDIGEVQISNSKISNKIRENQTGVIKLKPKQIETLPNFFGETDIIKVLQLMPGVQSGGEGKSDLYVRGGSPDQNLILMDDIPLYYVAHFGGFISIFNSDAISNVSLVKGGFPARYGSRLSSVLDVKMKNGNKKKFSGKGTVGLLSSKVLLEGPIIKEKASFLFSIRKNMLPVFKLFGADLDYGFFDLNAKISYSFSNKNKLFISGYMGNDRVGVKNEINRKEFHQKDKRETSWGNTVWSLKWNHIFSDKLFCSNTVGISNYRNSNDFLYSSISDSLQARIESNIDSKINDIIISSNFNWYVNPAWEVVFGPSVYFHKFSPNTESYLLERNKEIITNSFYNSEENAIETAFYCENNIKTNHFGANIGMRFSSYHINGRSYFSLEPRLLLNYIVSDDFSVKYSYSRMNQYVHLLSYSGVGMPTDYWMPTTKDVKPQNSIQQTLSLNKSFKKGQYQVSLEGYYKEMDNLISFLPGESLVGHLDEWTKTVAKNGQGESEGVELLLQKLTGNTTGWIGGTISKTDRQFDILNNGERFPFKYDRLLDISIVLMHKFGERLSMSGSWSFGSGYPTTLPTERYNTANGEVYAYERINSFRMRNYHRLDLAVNYKYKTLWGESTWTLSIFNVYNRMNPYYVYFGRELITIYHDSGVEGVPGNTFLYQKSLFPFFPSFAYSFKF